MIVCPEIKQKQPQDRKTIFETLSVPVAKILSPVARKAPTKRWFRRPLFTCNWKLPAWNWVSLLAIVLGSFFAYSSRFLLTIGALFRMAQEPNRNRKPEPLEPFFPKPKEEPEPPEPFSKNRNRNRNRPFSVKLYWNAEKPFLQRNRRNRKPEPVEPFHPQTVTEPNRGLPVFCSELSASKSRIPIRYRFSLQTRASQGIPQGESIPKKGKGYRNRAPSLLEPRVLF